jgi:NAD(P)H-hydrate epimerase
MFDVPDVPAESLPWLSVAQMREVDRLMVDELGISLERMTENAGRNLSLLARMLLGGDVTGRRVLVLAGPGGNGAGGLVTARQLVAAGAEVEVRLAAPVERMLWVPAEQVEVLRRLGVDVRLGTAGGLPAAELVLDALLGYSQMGPPRGEAATLIELAADRRVVSLDVPSGLELETGTLHEPHIGAATTLTLAAPKEGLRGQAAVGDLYLGDITVPAAVFARLGVAYEPPFSRGPVVRLR